MMSFPLSRFAMVVLSAAPMATASVVLERAQVTCRPGTPCPADVQLHLVVTCPASGESPDLLGGIADAVLARDSCAPEQQDFLQRDVRVCATGPFTFIRLRRRYPACAVSAARLRRGDQQVEVLLLK